MDAAFGNPSAAMQPDQTKDRGGLERSCGPMQLPGTLAAHDCLALAVAGRTMDVSATITKAQAAHGALPQHRTPPQPGSDAAELERSSAVEVTWACASVASTFAWTSTFRNAAVDTADEGCPTCPAWALAIEGTAQSATTSIATLNIRTKDSLNDIVSTYHKDPDSKHLIRDSPDDSRTGVSIGVFRPSSRTEARFQSFGLARHDGGDVCSCPRATEMMRRRDWSLSANRDTSCRGGQQPYSITSSARASQQPALRTILGSPDRNDPP